MAKIPTYSLLKQYRYEVLIQLLYSVKNDKVQILKFTQNKKAKSISFEDFIYVIKENCAAAVAYFDSNECTHVISIM